MFKNKGKLKVTNQHKLPPFKPELLTIPKGVLFSHELDGLRMEIDWKIAGSMLIPVAVLLVNFFVSFIFYHTYTGGQEFGLLFIFACYVAGLHLIYQFISPLFNKTLVKVRKDRISVEHTPINFLAQKNKSILTKDIKQLFICQRPPHQKKGKHTSDWKIYVVRNGHVDTPLLTGFKSLADAQFFEQAIEQYLNITDKPKTGEAPKNDKLA